MKQVAKAAGLKGFEMVKKLHLDSIPWSPDNGLLTPTFKMKRVDLKKKYQAQIDAMYTESGPPPWRPA